MNKESKHPWIAHAKARGLGTMLTLALNALEPIAPLGAQVLWILQPTAGLIGGGGVRIALADFAQALETPDGIASLRAELAQDEPDETHHQHETEV